MRGEFRLPPHFYAVRLGVLAAFGRAGSNEYPLHLVERDFLGAAVVKLRRARRRVVRHLRGLFKRAAVLQVSGDARGAEGVVADARGDAAGFRAPLNHRVGGGLGQGVAGKLDGRAQQRLRIIRKPRALDVLMPVGCRRREGRRSVAFGSRPALRARFINQNGPY